MLARLETWCMAWTLRSLSGFWRGGCTGDGAWVPSSAYTHSDWVHIPSDLKLLRVCESQHKISSAIPGERIDTLLTSYSRLHWSEDHVDDGWSLSIRLNVCKISRIIALVCHSSIFGTYTIFSSKSAQMTRGSRPYLHGSKAGITQ